MLKEQELRKFYTNTSFLLGAHTSYRSLFARFIDCLELLSVLNRCNRGGSLSNTRIKKRPLMNTSSLGVCGGSNNNASNLPNDSHVPKSSSLPSTITLHSNKNAVVTNDVNSAQITKGFLIFLSANFLNELFLCRHLN